MAIDSSNPNQAKETGGNLDTSVASLRKLEDLVFVHRQNRALLRVMVKQLEALTGVALDPNDFYED